MFASISDIMTLNDIQYFFFSLTVIFYNEMSEKVAVFIAGKYHVTCEYGLLDNH